MGRTIRRVRKTGQRRQPLVFTGVEPTKVLAVGNSQSFTENVSTLLADHDRIRLLGGAHDRTQAAERVVLLKPDVVVIEADLDYELGGIDTAFALRSISPTTAFVLVSPHSDPERLAMVPRGLGLEWSYILADGELNADDLSTAISSAAWSIPFIDRRIDRKMLGALQKEVETAVEKVLRTVRRSRRRTGGGSTPGLGYAKSADWTGNVRRFRLPGDENSDDPEDEA